MKPKAFTISSDDGMETDLDFTALMKKYGMKGTFNLNTAFFSPDGAEIQPGRISRPMSVAETVKLFSDPDFEVATHGHEHPDFTSISEENIVRDITNNRIVLEAMFGKPVRGHAYPFGTHNDTVIKNLASCGIVYARTCIHTEKFDIPEDSEWLRWHPTAHLKYMGEELDRFISGVPEREENAWLFYSWCHSYEFRQDNSWEKLEESFKRLRGEDNIWFATNMEIYEYVRAFRNLVYSADGTSVYNPSRFDVCLHYRDGIYEVKAGSSLRF